jgi:hypothetical protein
MPGLSERGAPRLLGKTTLSKLLDCSTRTIDRHTKQGILPKPLVFNGRAKWTVESIERVIEDRAREVAR